MDKKRIKASKFGNLLLFVIAYVLLSVVIRDIALTDKNIKILGFEITTSALRGIITQIQMLISVYIVLKENRMGYIASVLLNMYSMLIAIFFMVQTKSPTVLPGVISYAGAFLIITLIIFNYKQSINF